MDLPRLALRSSVLLCAAFLAVVVVLAASHKPELPAAAIVQGSASMAIPSEPGVQAATWNRLPVLVFVTTAKELDGVDAARGSGAATPSIDVPGHPDLRLFVLSAKSTFLGCTVGWNAGLGASKDIADYDKDGRLDGRILDPCHQGQWDAFHRGTPQPGGPAPERLAVLDVRIVGQELVGTGFDGPTTPVGNH